MSNNMTQDEKPMSNLSPLLEPRSVAVIGASKNVDKIGYKILKNIVDAGFEGKIFPINPRGGEILGLQAFASILDVPDEIDVAVIVVPAKFIPSIIEECVRKEVKGAVIISSGFRDIGPEGIVLENQILETAAKSELRIIGPNCQGVSNPQIGFCATWPLVENVGNVAIISQSGTIALEIPSFLSRNRLGYSKAIALGNKSDVDEADLIAMLTEDEMTSVIAVYSEGMKDGRKLMAAIKQASRTKPVIFLKAGKTEAGKKAVLAHTGSLAGNREVFEAAVKQSGGIYVNDLQELCDTAKAFSTCPTPRGNRLMVITSSGGSGILASDAGEDVGLKLSKLSDETVEALRNQLPSYCVIRNPLDLTGNALNNVQLYTDALKIVLEEKDVDLVLVIFGDPILGASDSLKELTDKASAQNIPVVVSFLGGADVQVLESEKLQKNGVPVYPTPGRAIKALGNMKKYWKIRKKESGK